MSALSEILHGIRRNLLLIGGGYGLAEGSALLAGADPVPGDLAGIFLGATVAVLAYPSVHEGILRHLTRRPRRTMTPEDYRHLRDLELDLGWEPSEPPMPVTLPAQPARSAPPPVACECVRYATDRALALGPCVKCRQRARRDREAQASLPAMLRETTIATMKPGRAYYTVPWAMRADEEGRLWLHSGHTADGRRCGTVQMRVERRSDGYHVWPVPGSTYAPGAVGGQCVPVAVLEGPASELAAPPSYALARSAREITAARAAIHFQALAQVGLQHCLCPCPICAERSR